ncbi:cell division-specific peptidoglycan biosynthesis regulator FtsW [Planifilum fimeticola]|jgi:cell division protein FtsW|uniref:Probable peptidoglycan glycosyltransferase FtsW n=1 Tax=Planifilum fimeticola TaxID=201975 RepID=A0A2T0LFR5_9BACL|nr:putative lipid II flippase FtsW [Planifilum fimeticola]PRX41076.1 cell division-specific peptidoglycan biosynthesis regulator FtsW [Planifilum fimeticola]
MVRGKPDFWLMFFTFLLLGFGLVMVFSASYYEGWTEFNDSYYFFKRQLARAGLGLILFFTFANIPFTLYRRHVGWILLGCVILLVLVFVPVIGVEANGASRWIQIGPLTIQPSELAKLALLIYTASIMTKKQPYLDNFTRGLLPPLIVIGLVCSLIMIEPHYSATIIILISCMVVIFCAGARIRHLLMLGLVAVPVLIMVLYLADYRIERLEAAYDPWKDPNDTGYQIIQSLYAIGPGGLSGRGLGNGIQKLAYLPEAHTDFIFAVIAEELGFFGGVFLILLFVALILRGIRASLIVPDQFGTLLGIGLITTIAIQALFNLAVVTAILPVTGVPLPLVSYGGSSLLINMASLGILLNISRYRPDPSRKDGSQS